MANSLLVIEPYRMENGLWAFDDERVGLLAEPFVREISAMMDRFVADIPGAAQGFTLLFGGTPFPGYTLKLDWQREEYHGNWYRAAAYESEGWLCPALFKYFDEAPKEIYLKAEAK